MKITPLTVGFSQHFKSLYFQPSQQKEQKIRFSLMSQESLNPKMSVLVQKVCSVARVHTQTDTHPDTKVNTEGVFPSTHHQGSFQFP